MMHRRQESALAWLAAVAAALAVSATLYADVTSDWWTVDSGVTLWSTGGTFELSGTIGQADAGPIVPSGGNISVTGGFWPVAAPSGPDLPGDCDGDGDVDADDFEAFAGCMAGPGVPPATGCDCSDLTGDGDADLADFAALQQAYTGAPTR